MPASHGCSPPFILAGFIPTPRISAPLVHFFSPLLCFFFFFFDWVCVWAGCLVWSSALCSSACVCLCVCTENERCVRWLFSTVSHNNCAYRAHRQTPSFHPLCCGNSLYNFLSGVRKGMAVSTITAVKAGLLFFLFFFFFLDRRQPGTQGDATPTKVYFNRFPGNIPAAWGSGASQEHPWGSRLVWFPKMSRWMRFLDARSASCTIKMAKGALAQWAPLSSAASETRFVSFSTLPRFRRVFLLVVTHKTQAARPQPVLSFFGFQRIWCAIY